MGATIIIPNTAAIRNTKAVECILVDNKKYCEVDNSQKNVGIEVFIAIFIIFAWGISTTYILEKTIDYRDSTKGFATWVVLSVLGPIGALIAWLIKRAK